MHFKLMTAIFFGHPTLCLVIEIQANNHQPSLSIAIIIHCHLPTLYLSGGLGGHLHPHRVVEPWPGTGRLHRLLHAHRHLQDTAVGVRTSHTLSAGKKNAYEKLSVTAARNYTRRFSPRPHTLNKKSSACCWCSSLFFFAFQAKVLPVRAGTRHWCLQACGGVPPGTPHYVFF